MFERFTDRARRVVVLAQQEARLLNHNYIGTEHILLGLIHEGEGVAAKALESLGISLGAVRSQVEEIIGGGESSPSGHIPFTPRAKKVLELSLREALQIGHNYIGTEHILLGLIREGEGVAAQVLVSLGADLSRVRQRVVQLLPGDSGPWHQSAADDAVATTSGARIPGPEPSATLSDETRWVLSRVRPLMRDNEAAAPSIPTTCSSASSVSGPSCCELSSGSTTVAWPKLSVVVDQLNPAGAPIDDDGRFIRYGPRVAVALTMADAERRWEGTERLQPTHLLHGLFRDSAVVAFIASGVDVAEVARTLPPLPTVSVAPPSGLPRASGFMVPMPTVSYRLEQQARAVAGDAAIDSRHYLLALMEDQQDQAASRALANLGITREQVEASFSAEPHVDDATED